ncbi:MAG TPA: hypothetical protein VFO99_06280, partial [Pyrinomonadaceae bacterium]|nr:hypothetical protein [Pyrinomonadaceae bacterium]
MARHTTERPWRSVMMQRLRRAYSRSTGADSMTLVTVQALRSIMLRMTKADTKRGRGGRSAASSAQLMTSAARRNIPPARLCTRRVTSKAVRVRIETRRYRQ